MQITEFKCRTSVSLFMAGADTKAPEIRAAGIKGVMRYIWRAAECSDNLTDLRKREGELFGCANNEDKRVCPWKIQTETAAVKTGDHPLLPYRKPSNPFNTPAVSPGTAFTVRIIGGRNSTQHRKIAELFVLTCMLGGFGRRSRKGMGTVVIDNITGIGAGINTENTPENCAALLNAVTGRDIYRPKERTVSCTIKGSKYPYIEQIYFIKTSGKSAEQLSIRIGNAAHINKQENPRDIFLGRGGKNRFASSLLLSSIPAGNGGFDCIITRLFCSEDPNPKNRAAFIDMLSKEVIK